MPDWWSVGVGIGAVVVSLAALLRAMTASYGTMIAALTRQNTEQAAAIAGLTAAQAALMLQHDSCRAELAALKARLAFWERINGGGK